MIYFLILMVMFFAWLFNFVIEGNSSVDKIERKTNFDLLFFVFVFLGLILILGLRGLTGTDTISYQSFYLTGMYPTSMEAFYISISSFFSSSGFSFSVFEFFVGALTLLPIAIQYWKRANNIYFATLLFYLFGFYLYAFNVSRQTLAASIIVYAFLNLNFKKIESIIVNFILIYIAMGIHKTSFYIIVLLFLIEFFSKFLFNNKKSLLILGIVGIFCSFIFYESNFVFNQLSSFSSNFSDYESYLTGSTASATLSNKSIYTFLFAVISSLIIIVYSRYPKKYRNFKFFSPFLLYTILEVLQVNWISDRMSIFTLPLVPLFLAHLVYIYDAEDKKQLKTKRLLICGLSLLLGILIFSRIVFQNFGDISPYLGIG